MAFSPALGLLVVLLVWDVLGEPGFRQECVYIDQVQSGMGRYQVRRDGQNHEYMRLSNEGIASNEKGRGPQTSIFKEK